MPSFHLSRWDNLHIVSRILLPTVALGLAVSGLAYLLQPPPWVSPLAVVLVMGAAIWIGIHLRVRQPLRAVREWIDRRADGEISLRLPVTSHDELIASAFQGEDHVHSILRTAADGIVTVDELGIVELSNPAAERMFGVERGL